MTAAPYADVASAYQRKGWSPVPLPPAAKAPPPTGWTGYGAPLASGADVVEWASNGHARGNVGLRTPETVLGLDVDAYDDKPGLATMLAAVERLGPLPPTVRSSSRADDPVSGIRFYTVPAGRCWADVIGPGVEVIHHGHRYAVAAPSVHPNGGVYRWHDAAGAPMQLPPAVAGLPELPPSWIADLDRGAVADRVGKADVTGDDVRTFLAAMPDGEPCAYVSRLVEEADTALSVAASRHDAVRGTVGRLVRAGDQGHRGAVAGLDTCQSLFYAALDGGTPRAADRGEWSRMVTGAVALVVKTPTSQMDKGCCPPERANGHHDGDQGVHLAGGDGDVQKDTSVETPDYAAMMAIEVEREAYKIRVRDAAREKVATEKAGCAVLPQLTRLDAFLAVPDEPVTHRIADLWPSGGRVVLSAPHKAGKSTLTGNLARSLVDGEPFLDHFTVEPVRRVILIDDELDERMLRRWLRDQSITNTAAVELVPLRGRLSAFNILDAATRTRWAQHLGPGDVLAFDCLRPALDALGLSEDKDAGRFLEALDELTAEAGIGELLVVHHMGHHGERSRGDSRILDWPDALWKLVRDAEDDDDTTQPRRYFTAYGRDVEQPEVLLSFDPATRRLSVAGGSRRDRKVDEALVAVLDALRDAGEPLSGRQVEERLRDTGPGRDTVRGALKRAIQTGDVLVSEGTRNAKLHHLAPSVRECAGSARAVRGALGSECASAPIGGARTLTRSNPSEREEESAHSKAIPARADLLDEDGQVLDRQCPGCAGTVDVEPDPACGCPDLHEGRIA